MSATNRTGVEFDATRLPATQQDVQTLGAGIVALADQIEVIAAAVAAVAGALGVDAGALDGRRSDDIERVRARVAVASDAPAGVQKILDSIAESKRQARGATAQELSAAAVRNREVSKHVWDNPGHPRLPT